MNTLFQRLAVAAVLGALAALAHPAGAQQTTGGGGTIAGRVTDADGGPVAGERVTARSTTYVGPGPAATALTGPDGRYTLRVDTQGAAGLFGPGAPPALAYTVAPAPGDQLYAVPADRAVTLAGAASPAAAGVDFVVTPGPQITVRVHDALTGRPVPGVRVEYPSISGGSAPGAVAGVTDAGGQARFRTHALNVNLQIRARPDLAPGPGSPYYGLYKQYQLTPADSVVWDVSVYDPAATVKIAWQGVLLGPDGRPAPNTLIRRVGQLGGGRGTTEDVVTDGKGRFTFPGTEMSAADYLARAQSQVLSAHQGDAEVFQAPTLDALTRPLTLQMVRTVKASLTGRVTDPGGVPLAGVPVRADGALPRPGPGARQFSGSVPRLGAYGVTDASGRFTLTGLNPGLVWSLTFGGPPQNGQGLWAYGMARYPDPPAGAPRPAWPALADGERRDAGTVVVPRADLVVAGRVVGPDGRPVAHPLAVELHGLTSDSTSSVPVNPDGTFRVEHLRDEPLTLTVYRTRDGGLYNYGPLNADYILQRAVTAGDQGVTVPIPAQPAPPPAPVAAAPVAPRPLVLPAPQPPPYPVTAPPAPGAGPAPDEAAAVRAAQRFLTAIGQPGGVSVLPGHVRFPPAFLLTLPAPGVARLAAAPTWGLSLSGRPFPELLLSRDAGIVGQAMLPAGAAAPGPPAPLTQDGAIRRGLAVLQAAGHAQELRLTDVRLEPVRQQWVMNWTRLFHGIPFPLGGSVTVQLDAATGRLAMLWTFLRQNDPPTDEVRVDAARAQAVADARLTQAGLTPLGAPSPPARQVVVPNAAWDAAPPPPPAPGDRSRFSPDRARVAWVVRRALPPPATGAAEVWVDAQTGAILGGLRPPTDPAPAAPASSP